MPGTLKSGISSDQCARPVISSVKEELVLEQGDLLAVMGATPMVFRWHQTTTRPRPTGADKDIPCVWSARINNGFMAGEEIPPEIA